MINTAYQNKLLCGAAFHAREEYFSLGIIDSNNAGIILSKAIIGGSKIVIQQCLARILDNSINIGHIISCMIKDKFRIFFVLCSRYKLRFSQRNIIDIWYYSAKYGAKKIIEYLSGISLFNIDKYYKVVITTAISNGHHEIYSLFQEKIKFISDYLTVILAGIQSNRLWLLEMLIEDLSKFKIKFKSILPACIRTACKYQVSAEIIKYLLRYNNKVLLLKYAITCRSEVLKLALDHGEVMTHDYCGKYLAFISGIVLRKINGRDFKMMRLEKEDISLLEESAKYIFRER